MKAPEVVKPEVTPVTPKVVPVTGAISPELGKSIAAELDVRFNGVQESFQEIPATMLFTDKQTRSTFAATSLEGARTRLAEVRKSFEKPVTPEVTKQPYLEKYRELVRKYPDRIDKHLERAKDEKASIVLGREYGESFDNFLERRPDVKRRWDELTIAIKEMEKRGGNPAFTAKEAKSIAKELGIDFKRYDVEQFRQGINVELEHCNVTNCDPLLTGKIAQAHLNELPDYYTRLAKMEEASRMYTPDKIEAGHRGTKAPAEKGSLEQRANALLPMLPEEGPPLPRMFDLKWPWKK